MTQTTTTTTTTTTTNERTSIALPQTGHVMMIPLDSRPNARGLLFFYGRRRAIFFRACPIEKGGVFNLNCLGYYNPPLNGENSPENGV